MGSSINVLAAGVVFASLAIPLAASAQPSGGTVVFGGATISTPSATSTLIKQSTNSAIINWQSFSLSSGSSVVFDQPGAASIALNRVLGGGVSQIDGNLSANGQVWIINANGILFGKGSQINVAGLLATTSDIADGDFAAGRYNFSSSSNPSASVDNAGTIHVANGGSAVLSAPHVSNSGLIEADGGQIVLGGASAFTVDFEGDNLLRYAITTPVSTTPIDANGVARKELVGNSGTLSAAGGRILLTARAAANVADNVVNNSGMISATSAKLVNGEVVLDAGSGSVQDSGTIAATGNGTGESGGNVALAGNSVTLADGAVIDASGDSGGGTVSIGGGLHGSGPYQSAQNTTVAANATVHADAHTNGNGGTVSIWSVGITRFAGLVTAMGGSQSGNGGMVETSGHILNVADTAMVGTGAPHGTRGDWLLDPVTLTIVDSTADPQPDLSGGLLPYSDPTSTITALTIEQALIGPSATPGGTNVTLQAVDDIFVNAAIIAHNTGHTLTLDAGRSIFVNADITITGKGSGVVLSANNAGAPGTDAGIAGISGSGIITGDTVGLILGTNPANTAGTIGSSGSALNIGGGVVSIQSNGADAFVQNAGASAGLVLGSSNLGAGHLTALSSGDLTIAAGSVLSSSASGNAIVLSAATDFVNDAGSGAIALTGSGRFLIYSAAPEGDTFGGLNSGNTAIWNRAYPDAISAAGSRYVFAFQPTLTLTTTDQAKTYGVDDSAALASAYTVSGFDPGVAGVYLADTTATALSGAPSITSAGSAASASVAGGPYAITIAPGTLTSPSGYAFAFVSSGLLTVNAATLTYVADPFARTYGSPNPVFTGTVTGFVNSDTLASATTGSLTFTSPATASSNVGSYAINGSGLSANNGNYVFVQAASNATALTIGAATLTYVATPVARTYGSPNPVFGGTVTGFVNSDTLASATTGTLTFTSPATQSSNVGSYAIDGSGLSANNGNYVFVQAAGNATALTIGAATLTYVADPFARTYGAANPVFTGTVTGFVNSDTLASATTGTLTFASPATQSSNVGSYAIDGSGLTANHGNYVFAQAAGNATALTINPATLTYVATAAARTYGSPNPAFTGTVTGFVNSDTLASATTGSLTFTSPATASSNVGSYAIDGSGLSANNGNYVFAQAAGNATALTINPATLTYVADPVSRAYGTANPIFTGGVTGFVNSDTLASATTGTLTFTSPATASSSVGHYAINGSGLSANNGNYVFVQAAGNATALTITAALLSVVADPQSKVYGTPDPALTYTFSGLVNGDTSAVFTGALTRAPGKNVGNYAITQGTLSAGANYTIAFTGANFAITPALLSVTANTQTKVYGAADPKLTYTFSGLVSGDTSAVFSGALSRAAGQNVGDYAISQGTLTAGANYTIAFTGANFSITPATLTYVANAVNRTYGSANPALGGTVTGFVNGDTLASATGGSLSFTTSATAGSNVGSYAITGSGLSANNGNYVFVQSAANATALTINPATLTYVATSGAIDQGSPIPLLTGSVTGFVNGDTLQSATTGALLFTTTATSSSPPGDYAITGSGLSANHGNYIFVQDPGNASALKINNIVVQNVGLDGFYPWVSQGDPDNSALSLFDQENNGTDQYYVVADGGGGNDLPAPDTTTLSGPIAELTAAQGYIDPATNSDRRSSSLSHYFGNGSLFDDNFPSWGNDSYWH